MRAIRQICGGGNRRLIGGAIGPSLDFSHACAIISPIGGRKPALMKPNSWPWILCGALPLLTLFGLSASPARAEDFPEGAGKTIIMRSCGACHSTDQIARQKKSE